MVNSGTTKKDDWCQSPKMKKGAEPNTYTVVTYSASKASWSFVD